jgi:hypothetical protein
VRTPAAGRHRADHGQLDADLHRERLRLPAGVLQAGAGAGTRRRRVAGNLDGGSIGRSLADGDIELRVPHPSTAHVQEIHILALHCVCDAIDQIMFPEEAQ